MNKKNEEKAKGRARIGAGAQKPAKAPGHSKSESQVQKPAKAPGHSKSESQVQKPAKAPGHTHSHTQTKKVQNRLARAAGHLEYVRKMVDDGEDCTEVLMQLAAVKSALNNTAKIILQDHIEHCIAHAVEDGDAQAIEDLNKAIERYMD